MKRVTGSYRLQDNEREKIVVDTNRLIGMRVMNTGNHAIGTIEYIRDGVVAVNYHGSIAKHSYPSAFSSILELEDEELQEEIEGESVNASFENFKLHVTDGSR